MGKNGADAQATAVALADESVSKPAPEQKAMLEANEPTPEQKAVLEANVLPDSSGARKFLLEEINQLIDDDSASQCVGSAKVKKRLAYFEWTEQERHNLGHSISWLSGYARYLIVGKKKSNAEVDRIFTPILNMASGKGIFVPKWAPHSFRGGKPLTIEDDLDKIYQEMKDYKKVKSELTKREDKAKGGKFEYPLQHLQAYKKKLQEK